MIEVIIYVEGPSDVSAMNELLKGLIVRKQKEEVHIGFFEAPPGDKKSSIIRQVPKRAVNILLNKPDSIVVAMPDLYPYNRAFPHETPAELEAVIREQFTQALREKGLTDDERYLQRFRVFCFKHDLEVLLLAAHSALALRLDTETLEITWRVPVEDQNNDVPPKRVVEALFRQHGQRYEETVDAPLILGMADYHEIAAACSQCFQPFVEFLESIRST